MINLKICIVNGQNHKGSTYHLGQYLAKKIGGEVTEFFLPRDFGEFCVGCNSCFLNGEETCPHYEKLSPINKAMDSADLLIFTSPVYVYHCTGSMKAFLDHYGYRWLVHRPEEKMFSKQAVCISTAAGGGMKSTCKDMKDSMYFWGVGKIYTCGVGVHAVKWDEVPNQRREIAEKKLDSIARKVKANYGRVKPSIKTKAFFNVMRTVHNKKSMLKIDTDYWKDKGWTQKARPWK